MASYMDYVLATWLTTWTRNRDMAKLHRLGLVTWLATRTGINYMAQVHGLGVVTRLATRTVLATWLATWTRIRDIPSYNE
jgi:hypothetical protein